MSNAVTPPKEHEARRWHWIDTEYGIMAASWYPLIGEHGSWDISGHCYGADSPKVLREWRYLGPDIPPESVCGVNPLTAEIIRLPTAATCGLRPGELRGMEWATMAGEKE